MRFNRFSKKWIVAPALIGLAASAGAFVSAGCGGGGGGGGGHSPVNTNSYSGTVTDQSGDLISGDIVSFDGSSSYRTTTNSSGAFTVSGVPTSALTASDYLLVTDANGTEVAEYSLAGSSGSVSGITITIGPPAPPSGLVVKR